MKKKYSKTNKNVFFSFDAPNDKFLKNAVVGQTKNKTTPFAANDKSLKRPQPQSKWVKVAEQKIKKADLVMVMLGKETHKALGVKKEIALAHKHGVPVVQVKPQSSRAKPVKNGGRLHNWTHKNMKKLLMSK